MHSNRGVGGRTADTFEYDEKKLTMKLTKAAQQTTPVFSKSDDEIGSDVGVKLSDVNKEKARGFQAEMDAARISQTSVTPSSTDKETTSVDHQVSNAADHCPDIESADLHEANTPKISSRPVAPVSELSQGSRRGKRRRRDFDKAKGATDASNQESSGSQHLTKENQKRCSQKATGWQSPVPCHLTDLLSDLTSPTVLNGGMYIQIFQVFRILWHMFVHKVSISKPFIGHVDCQYRCETCSSLQNATKVAHRLLPFRKHPNC